MTYIQQSKPSLTAFWENTSESKHPEIQVLFQYGIVAGLVRTTIVWSGTVTAANGNAIVWSGAAASSSAIVESEAILTYKAGQWWQAMFSLLFPWTPVAWNDRAIWFWEKDVDWFFIWYNWTSLWILHINNTVKTWIPQTSWNWDKADWTGELPVIDTTKGNVCKIQWQHLWYWAIQFFLEKPWTWEFIKIHTIEYANANLVPSQRNPSNPILAYSENTTNTTNMEIRSASMAGFVEWEDVDLWLRHTVSVLATWTTTNKNILTIRGKSLFWWISNKVVSKPLLISASCDGNKWTTFTVVTNWTFTWTPVWTDVDTPGSTLEYDTAWVYTIWTWEPVFWFDLAKVWSDKLELKSFWIELRPQDTISIIADSASVTDIKATIVMNEEF